MTGVRGFYSNISRPYTKVVIVGNNVMDVKSSTLMRTLAFHWLVGALQMLVVGIVPYKQYKESFLLDTSL